MTPDLAAWLLADDGPIAEDERRARALLRIAQNLLLDLADYVHSLGRVIPGWDSWPDVERMCEQKIAECAAKRRILSCQPDANADPGEWGLWYNVLDTIAQPYAGRPGWQDEWAA